MLNRQNSDYLYPIEPTCWMTDKTMKRIAFSINDGAYFLRSGGLSETNVAELLDILSKLIQYSNLNDKTKSGHD